jgi:hypothetical protein
MSLRHPVAELSGRGRATLTPRAARRGVTAARAQWVREQPPSARPFAGAPDIEKVR